MVERSRTRRRLKWGLTAVCLLPAVLTGLTCLCPFAVTSAFEVSDGEVWRVRGDVSISVFPLWPIAFAFIIAVPVLWVFDRRRTPPGRCQNCGYNLTGNVSGRCAECGMPTSAAQGGARSEG